MYGLEETFNYINSCVGSRVGDERADPGKRHEQHGGEEDANQYYVVQRSVSKVLGMDNALQTKLGPPSGNRVRACPRTVDVDPRTSVRGEVEQSDCGG